MSGDHKHPSYVTIWLLLTILTAIEFAVAIGFKKMGLIAPMIILLLGLAFTKAALVAMYFMHLRFERKLFVLVACSPLILALILVFALMPDVARFGFQ